MTGVDYSSIYRRPTLSLTHFGAAGWSITDGTTTVLLDPYLSRIRFKGRKYGPHDATEVPGDTRTVVHMDEPPTIDTATIDARIPRANYILLSHSHFNHCMDVPYIAQRTGAVVIGTESTASVAQNGGVPEEQTIVVKGGEDLAFPELSLQVIPSLHSPLSCKLYRDFGTVPLQDCPLTLNEYVEGGTLAYLLRLAGRKILLFGSMNFIEREVEGLRPDIALIASAPPRLDIHDYTGRLLRATGKPPVVIATHWDDQGLPYGASQAKALGHTEQFVEEVKAVNPDASVIVPHHFQTITIEETISVSPPEHPQESG
jgi:L-ascorbate metabolism protein UlaG (beta-lactamase superfamily)